MHEVASSLEPGNGSPAAAAPVTQLFSPVSSTPWNYGDGGMPPPRPDPRDGGRATFLGPFHGDYDACAWNAQALFASRTTRQTPKMSKAVELARKHDFSIYSEAHCLRGRADALCLPAEFTAVWSNGTASTAGIGIVLKRSFLAKFHPVDRQRDWLEIVPGYVAVLRLNGPSGSLDVFCCYFPTGQSASSQNRTDAMAEVARYVRPQAEALSIMAGDFNFVEKHADRMCETSGEYSGNTNAGEAEIFEAALRNPHGFHEMEQDQFTFKQAGTRSR